MEAILLQVRWLGQLVKIFPVSCSMVGKGLVWSVGETKYLIYLYKTGDRTLWYECLHWEYCEIRRAAWLKIFFYKKSTSFAAFLYDGLPSIQKVRFFAVSVLVPKKNNLKNSSMFCKLACTKVKANLHLYALTPNEPRMIPEWKLKYLCQVWKRPKSIESSWLDWR